MRYSNGWAATAAGVFVCAMLMVAPARGEFIINANQVGSDVVMTGSGTINTAGLNQIDIGGIVADIHPATGDLYMGPTSNSPIGVFTSISGPSNFGSGGDHAASSGSGPTVGVSGDALILGGFSPGTMISDTDTYSGQTLASLGLKVGSYEWTWGSGANADSLTLNIIAPSTSTAAPLPPVVWTGLTTMGIMAVKARRARSR